MSFDQATYEAWRARFPWTDQEFHDALMAEGATRNPFWKEVYEKAAKRALEGRISAWIVKESLSRLIKKCRCGKPALYRNNTTGACSAHRHELVTSRKEYSKTFDLKAQAADKVTAERERRLKRLDGSRQSKTKAPSARSR